MEGKLQSYLVTKDFKSPYLVITGMAHIPHKIAYKQFKKGQVVNGKMHYKDGIPSFVMVAGTLVVPIEYIKLVVTKDVIMSNADAKGSAISKMPAKIGKKIRLIDAAIVGAIAGFGAVWFAEKKGWIKTPDKKNKIAGIAIGAVLFGYVAYRFSGTTGSINRKLEVIG